MMESAAGYGFCVHAFLEHRVVLVAKILSTVGNVGSARGVRRHTHACSGLTGVLADLSPEEAVALLSALVFQEKSDAEPVLPP